MLRDDPDKRPELNEILTLDFLAAPVARHRAVAEKYAPPLPPSSRYRHQLVLHPRFC